MTSEAASPDRRLLKTSDRRKRARGGRRAYDVPGRCPVVLVAEGYEGARRAFVRYFERFGFHVEEAETVAQASTAVQRIRPQVLLCDLNLADLRSLIATAEVGQLGSTATAIGLVSLEGAERPAGLAGVLVKPFRLRAMLEEVRQALRASQRRSGQR